MSRAIEQQKDPITGGAKRGPGTSVGRVFCRSGAR